MRDAWRQDKEVARAILRHRSARRRVMVRILGVVMVQFALGLWMIDDWLASSPWRFLWWWLACGMAAFFLLLFAVYDALKVIQEMKSNH